MSLPKELEEFVPKKTASGQYLSAEDVGVEALREFQSKEEDESGPALMDPLRDEACPAGLRAILVDAVRGPHHPMPTDCFEQLGQQIRFKGAK